MPASTYLVRQNRKASYARSPAARAEVPIPVTLDGATPGAVSSAGLCQKFHKQVCRLRGVTRDPTGIVRPDSQGEIRALRLVEEIIHQHPDWESEQVDDELARQIFTPAQRARLQSVFQWVRRTMIHFIREQPQAVFSAKEKEQLTKQLLNVTLQVPPPVSLYADEPDLLTKNDIYFERLLDGQLRLRVGGAFNFTSLSWFNMVFTFAHELGHSIDPCEARVAHFSFPAYATLAACLIHQGMVRYDAERIECGDKDQLSEAFADWMAVQVSVRALKSYAQEFHGQDLYGAVVNTVRDLCEQEDSISEVDLSLHPSPEVRIEKIFGRHPAVRELLGCNPAEIVPYCSFTGEGGAL